MEEDKYSSKERSDIRDYCLLLYRDALYLTVYVEKLSSIYVSLYIYVIYYQDIYFFPFSLPWYLFLPPFTSLSTSPLSLYLPMTSESLTDALDRLWPSESDPDQFFRQNVERAKLDAGGKPSTVVTARDDS